MAHRVIFKHNVQGEDFFKAGEECVVSNEFYAQCQNDKIAMQHIAEIPEENNPPEPPKNDDQKTDQDNAKNKGEKEADTKEKAGGRRG